MNITKFDRIVNVISIGIMAAVTVFILLRWNDLPEQIPSHYNFRGEPDDYGGRGTLVFELVTGWVIVLTLWILGKFPQLWNTGVERTPVNEAVINRIIKDMVNIIQVSMAILFSYMALVPVLQVNMGVWFMPLFLAAIFGSIIVTVVRLLRNR